MAAALSIGDDMSPSRIRGKSDESQQKLNEGVDFTLEYENEGPTTNSNMPIAKKIAKLDSSLSKEDSSKTKQRALSGGRPPSLEFPETQDFS